MHLTTKVIILLTIVRVASSGATTGAVKEIICPTVDIRHSSLLHTLDKCTVVDGNLIVIFPIAFDDNPTSSKIQNTSFPLLREVTGFVLLHILGFVKSLYTLFPNLTVIRGSRLFLNYALVINDCEHLEEITLRNLLQISRGSMRIGGNITSLCFPRKIDFDSIIMNGRVILPIEPFNRSVCKIDDNRCNDCYAKDKCWHNGACQRWKASYFVNNIKIGSMKCHELCLGACIDATARGCFTCKDIRENNECVESCSANMFLNTDSRRCIDRQECIRLERKIYNQECLSDCPSNYTEQLNEVTQEIICMPCLTKCPKKCNFPEIRSVSQLEKIGSGCTIISGSLEINILEDINNLTQELQTYLGDVEEIHGILKIHRSTPITSLTFLNKLRRVHGLGNNADDFAIRIFDNWNLQTFFDQRLRSGTKLEVKFGSVLIYRNGLLCENEINNFLALIEPNDMSVRRYDYIAVNGNMRTCRNEFIKTYIKVLSHNQVEISWEDTEVIENYTVTAYILQYVAIDDFEMKEFDENILYERDTCSAYGWINVELKEEDIRQEEKDGKKIHAYTLKNLEQYTTYAFTIQPYSYKTIDAIRNLTLSGASDVNRFRTLMNVPSSVIKVATHFKTSTSLLLEWDVLSKEKDVIKQFFIHVYELPTLDDLDQRDYCENSIENEKETKVVVSKTELSSMESDYNRCCEKCCEDDGQKKQKREKEDDSFKGSLIKFTQNEQRIDRDSRQMMSRFGFERVINVGGDKRELEVDKLKVFTFYALHIYACTDDRKCSNYERHSDRTAIEENFDKINQLVFTTTQFLRGTFNVYFDEPEKKNGAIISYLIEIREKIDKETIPIDTQCVTRKNHANNKFLYTAKDLLEGDYMIRVAAVSLAQQGQFSDWHFFKIIRPKEELPIGFISLGLGFAVALILGASISYYYKHKIITVFRRQNDTSYLMGEMEQTDFNEVALHHCDSGKLSDIFEDEE